MEAIVKENPYTYLVAITTKAGMGSMVVASKEKKELWEIYGMFAGKEDFTVFGIQILSQP